MPGGGPPARREATGAVTTARLDLRLLAGAFAAVVALFFAADAVSERSIRRVDAASDEIAFNTAPSIEHLAAVRTWVSHLEFLLGLAGHGDEGAEALASTLAQLDGEVNAYLALPTFRGEAELWREVQLAHEAFDGAVRRALSRTSGDAPDPPPLTEVSATADRLSVAASRALEFNARNGRALALRIKEVRRNASRIHYALNTAAGVLALLAALVIHRHLRRYRSLVEAHAAAEQARGRELEAFAGRAAHDVHNPISAAQLALSLVARRGLPDPRSAELVERALRNLTRVRTVVEGLLQFARAGAQPPTGVSADVPAVVDDVAAGIRPAAEAEAIELVVERVEPCHVTCGPGVLTSVLSNLVQNAVKYMGRSGGTRRITLRGFTVAGLVRLEVEDTGPGIPPEWTERIFLPYERAGGGGQEGLGLGLATVKRLCDAYGGRAGVRSTPGHGSVFWIELPSFPLAPRLGAPS
ncbi:MAG TPA: HAMP domain-containing sensor histidine kinase [Anaeromyxobacteraceae bacterium]|jgi:signal transduction histidine kinase|nr:HAMP domain-containing sensor histidine kinase [Anaeromyxobacteraceae bacterium]